MTIIRKIHGRLKAEEARKLHDGKIVEGVDNHPASSMWKISDSNVYADSISGYIKLSELALAIPIGSVENERRFSGMNLYKTPMRNALGI